MSENNIQQIINNLKSIDPYLILLFGSHAYGTPHADSDIDLLVVTNDDYMPENFNQRNELYLSVSRQIRSISQQVPIDLLVYTKPMYQKFIAQKSIFSREIIQKGKILYERDNKAMA